ncbi:MAG: TVP38/TMEM64 family protein [Dermatophilaceae bacterium]
MSDRTQAGIRGLVLVIVLLLGGGLAVLLLGGDLEVVAAAVASSGGWGPLVYLALHVVLTLVPVPRNLLATIAGALFGMTWGAVLSWSGSVAAAMVGFALARRLGRDTVHRLTGARLDRLDDIARRRGLLAEVVARVTPFVPFTVVNYGSGLSAMRWRDYVAGTAVGVVPGTVAYVAVGASAGRDLTTMALGAGAGVVLLAAAALLARRHRREDRTARH